jgi:hypothetical protein
MYISRSALADAARMSLFTRGDAHARCVAALCVTGGVGAALAFERYPLLRAVPLDAAPRGAHSGRCTWRCADSVHVQVIKTDGRTLLRVPSASWRTRLAAPEATLPPHFPDGAVLLAQYTEDTCADGDAEPRLLVYDLLFFDGQGNDVSSTTAARRYERLLALFAQGAPPPAYVAQWVGFAPALEELLRDPAKFGLRHSVDGVVHIHDKAAPAATDTVTTAPI